MDQNYYAPPTTVADSYALDRSTFIRKTYGHLAGALLAFILIDTILLSIPGVQQTCMKMFRGQWTWLIVLGAYMVVSMIAHRWASSATSIKTQYFGLGLYVLAESIIFLPLLTVTLFIDPNILPKAGLITTGLFLGLTWIAFSTKKDFSFLGGFLKIAFMVSLGTIVASVIFGFSLGIIFSVIMVAILGASVLYSTSNIIHHYHTSQYVAAALGLFSAFATMLWYVIQILLSLAND